MADEKNTDLVHLIGFAATDEDLSSAHDGLSTVAADDGPSALYLAPDDDALEALTTAHEVLIAVAAKATTLPVKHGTLVPEDKLKELAVAQQEIARRFEGLAEARIVATYKEDEVADQLSGEVFADTDIGALDDIAKGRMIAEGMARLRATDQTLLIDALDKVASQVTRPEVVEPWDMVRLSVLLPKDGIDKLEERLKEVAEDQLSTCRFELTAPLPLYSFV